MPLPSAYTWTTRASGNTSANRPYHLLDGNLRLYDNDFASMTVDWTAVSASGTDPGVAVSGGTFNQTSSVVGLSVYRTDTGLAAPFFAAEVDCSAYSTGSRTVDTFVGIGLVSASGAGYLIYRYNVKTHLHELIRRRVGGQDDVIASETVTLSAPFTLTIALTGPHIICRATSAGSSVDTVILETKAHRCVGFDLEQADDLADMRIGWMAGSTDADLATGSTASVTIDAVRSAVFGQASVRETYPVVTKATGGPITDGSGRILVSSTNEGVSFDAGDLGTANWGLFWYDPATYSLSDCITRIYSKRPDGRIAGDSDGQIVYDETLKQWHIYVTTTGGYPTTPFEVAYQRYDGNLLNAGVVVLDSIVPLTLPSGIDPASASYLIYDPSVRYIAGEWYIWFGVDISDNFHPVLAKGSTPESFTTLIADLTVFSGCEGTKFAYLDGAWYALVSGGGSVTNVFDLTGAYLGNTLLTTNPPNSRFEPHPSILTEQFNDGADKRRYHRVTFEDSETTSDGYDWSLYNSWQFGSLFVETTEERTGWDHPESVADTSSYSAATPDYAVEASATSTPSGRAITLTITPTASWTATVTPGIATAGTFGDVTGTFSPTSLSWSSSATPKTVTFTPSAEGNVDLYFRNSLTANDPPNLLVTVESAWDTEVRSDKPLGWWLLGDHTLGRSPDQTVSGIEAAGSGLSAVDSIIPAEPVDSVDFDGTGGVTVAEKGIYDLTVGTIKAWIQTTSPGSSFRLIIGKDNAFALFLNDGVLVTFDWSASAIRSTGVNLADGAAHEVAMTFQSGVTNGTKIYIDGSLSLTTTITVSAQDHPLRIGTASVGQNFSGKIGGARIYPTALSATRILADYTAASTTTPSTPATPTSFAITTIDATGMTVGWTGSANAGSFTDLTYQIERSTNGTDFTLLTYITGTSYKDTTTVNGVTYYYRVYASSAEFGESAVTDSDSGVAQGPREPGTGGGGLSMACMVLGGFGFGFDYNDD